MKKTFGVLLIVCFVLSVTAAAVSAGSSNEKVKGNAYGHYKEKNIQESTDSVNGNENYHIGYNGNGNGNENTGDLNGIFNGNVFGDKTKIKIKL